jgi:hypothetical protein
MPFAALLPMMPLGFPVCRDTAALASGLASIDMNAARPDRGGPFADLGGDELAQIFRGSALGPPTKPISFSRICMAGVSIAATTASWSF